MKSSKKSIKPGRTQKQVDNGRDVEYRRTEAMKRQLVAGQCPHDGSSFCEHCIGGE